MTNPLSDLDEAMNRFRVASRELFNHFFRMPNPYGSGRAPWVHEERFQDIQRLLFQKLVVEPFALESGEYGTPRTDILVKVRHEGAVPIMLNRGIDSGYWDYPVKEVDNEVCLQFIAFFDWDALDFRDNRYVRVRVDCSVACPEIVGKHGLVESQHVRFVQAPQEMGLK